jgi:hypothetical protein
LLPKIGTEYAKIGTDCCKKRELFVGKSDEKWVCGRMDNQYLAENFILYWGGWVTSAVSSAAVGRQCCSDARRNKSASSLVGKLHSELGRRGPVLLRKGRDFAKTDWPRLKARAYSCNSVASVVSSPAVGWLYLQEPSSRTFHTYRTAQRCIFDTKCTQIVRLSLFGENKMKFFSYFLYAETMVCHWTFYND